MRKVLAAKLDGKTSIYDHVVKVVDRIVQSCPDRAIERFEEISYLIKNSDTLKIDDFVRCQENRQYAKYCADMAEGTKEGIE